MTTQRYSRAPSGPGVIKTTQRVNETLDYDAGTTDACFDNFAREMTMPRHGSMGDMEMDDGGMEDITGQD